MATLQKIPQLIDRFAMDDKLNMLADGVNNLVDGFGPYLDKAIDAAQDAEQAAEDATNAAKNVQTAIDGANTAANAANAAASSATNAASSATNAAGAANTAAEAATSAAGSATSAASAANTAAQAANEAAENANTAATNAGEAVAGIDDKVQEAVNERVLAKQYGPASVISASGVCENVPVAGAKVFGETRQNLWVNPAGTNNGVTVTSNGNGSMTLSGTATSAASVSSADSYIIKPSTAYTLSMNAALTGASFVVTEYDADGSQLAQHSVSSKSAASFTSSASVARCVMSLSVQSGQAVSRTYRVMLNEGSEPEPWCPPGLSSVSELSVVSAGSNLLDIPATQTIEAYGGPYTFSMDDDGWVSCSKDSDQRMWGYEAANVKTMLPAGSYTASIQFSEASSTQGLQVYTADGTRVCHIQGGSADASQSFALDAPTEVGVMYKLAGARARVQLELGSTATAYEPPAVTTTPVDLSGHQLRSLPDGTRDVLTVDGSGAVSVEQAVKCLTIDGTNVKAAYKNNFQFSLLDAYRSVPVSDKGVAEIFCDSLPVVSAENVWKGSSIGIGVNASGTIVFAPPGNLSTIEDANTWLSQHPVTVIYPLATPTIVPLDPITPPTVSAADATLWAASDVTADIEASLWEPFAEEGGMQQKALIGVAKAAAQAGLITVKETVMRWSTNEYPLYIFNMKTLNKAIYIGIATIDSFANNRYSSPDIPYYADITPLSGIITGAVRVPSKSDTGIYDYPAIIGYIQTSHTQQGYAGYSSVNGYAWNDTTIQKGWCMIFGECEPTD